MEKNFARGTRLTVPQAGLLLNLSHNTVRKYADQGLISCERSRGGHRSFSVTDLLALKSKLAKAEKQAVRLGRKMALLSQAGAGPYTKGAQQAMISVTRGD